VIVADYIFESLADRGVKDVFTVSGGGIMYLLDALGRNPDIDYWCNYHEQACAIAAESYARIQGDIGVCLVTTGPGSANALSAITGAWLDSVPVVVISGQVRTGLIADYSKHRQIGPQEINIIDMARPVTKYAKTIMNGHDVPAELEAAIAAATSGRPGPVWLNIPLDVQAVEIDPRPEQARRGTSSQSAIPGLNRPAGVRDVLSLLIGSQRPLVVAGNGIHAAAVEEVFERFVTALGCPVVTTMGGMDLLEESHPLYLGRFGPTGQRRANFTLQNADLLLCLGTSMSVSSAGFDTARLAPRAKRVMVNIDGPEMEKPHFHTDFRLLADLKWFMERLLADPASKDVAPAQRWIDAVARWKHDYPIVTSDYFEDTDHVNSYVLASRLSESMLPGDVLLTGNGTDAVSAHHSFAVKKGQRVITNYGFGAMGWDLPAAVGACIARGGARTVLVTGDGSMQMNVQELLTIGHNHLNVKVFVLNNEGYESMRATQTAFCDSRFVACHPGSGVANPDFEKLAAAYGLRYELLSKNDELAAGLVDVMATDGPWLCEVNVSPDQEKRPRIASRRRPDGSFESSPLDDQYPFLPREERDAVMSTFADPEA